MSITNPRSGLGRLAPGSRLKSSLKPVYVTNTGKYTTKTTFRGKDTHRHSKRYYYDPETDQIITERQYSKQSSELGYGFTSKEQKTYARSRGYRTPKQFHHRNLTTESPYARYVHRQPIDEKVDLAREDLAVKYAEWWNIQPDVVETGDYITPEDALEFDDYQELADELEALLREQRELIDDPFSPMYRRSEVNQRISEILAEIPTIDQARFWAEISP